MHRLIASAVVLLSASSHHNIQEFAYGFILDMVSDMYIFICLLFTDFFSFTLLVKYAFDRLRVRLWHVPKALSFPDK